MNSIDVSLPQHFMADIERSRKQISLTSSYKILHSYVRYVFEQNADEYTIIKLSNAQYGSDRRLETVGEPKKYTKVDPSLRMIGFFSRQTSNL